MKNITQNKEFRISKLVSKTQCLLNDIAKRSLLRMGMQYAKRKQELMVETVIEDNFV